MGGIATHLAPKILLWFVVLVALELRIIGLVKLSAGCNVPEGSHLHGQAVQGDKAFSV